MAFERKLNEAIWLENPDSYRTVRYAYTKTRNILTLTRCVRAKKTKHANVKPKTRLSDCPV